MKIKYIYTLAEFHTIILSISKAFVLYDDNYYKVIILTFFSFLQFNISFLLHITDW